MNLPLYPETSDDTREWLVQVSGCGRCKIGLSGEWGDKEDTKLTLCHTSLNT